MRPLEGLLVVALEQAVAAPFCTLRLAQAGARVIKIERAEGDLARGYDAVAGGDSSYFAWLNQGKESLVLDFKTPDDAALLRRILRKADVMVQNFAPGALDRAGFAYGDLAAENPRLIRCDISGYGAADAIASKRAYDLLVQAESGLIACSGAPQAPGRIGVSLCDIGAGGAAYAGVLEALLGRAISGKGVELAVSLFDFAAEWMTVPYLHAEFGAGPPEPAGLKHPSIAPYGAFACKDGKLVLISIQNEREWQRLCGDALNQPDLASRPEFASNIERVRHREALDAAIGAICATLSAAEFCARLEAAKIAYGALNHAGDLARHPAFRSRNLRNSNGVELPLPAPPVVWPEAPDAAALAQVPKIGAHSAAIRREFSA